MTASQRQNKGAPASIVGPRLVLLITVFALVLLGLVMVYSTSSVKAIEEGLSVTFFIGKQLIFTVAGVGGAIAAMLISYRKWLLGRWLIPVVGFVGILLVITAVAGTSNYGATRWLSVAGFSLQPSELAKVAFVLIIARIVTLYIEGEIELRAALFQGILFVFIPLIVLVYKAQSDLGTTVIIAVGLFAVMWIGGVEWRLLLAIAVVGFIGIVCTIVGTDYRSDRMVYLDPWNDGEDGYGAGYNIIRSYFAIAEGGILGVGLGNSHEKFQYLFASESDFIYAILCEELGMVGGLLVIAAFVVFLLAGLRIAAGAPDTFGRLVAGGCTVMIVFQAFLNIGCVIGVLPTTGKPLPFISSGGSSMISTMIMVGLILGVSRAAEKEYDSYADRRADLRLVHSEGRPFGYEGVEVLEGVSYRDDSRGRSQNGASNRRGHEVGCAANRSQGRYADSGEFSRIEMPRSTRR